MKFLNASEPLGLPKGSVRALIALMANATGMYLFATGAAISSDFVALLMLVDSAYFIVRGVADASDNAGTRSESLPEPFIPTEDES
jgi:hypothetical protein